MEQWFELEQIASSIVSLETVIRLFGSTQQMGNILQVPYTCTFLLFGRWLKQMGSVICNELETVDRLFFGCVVVEKSGKQFQFFFGTTIGSYYLPIAQFWIADNKHSALHAICSAVLWSI